MPGIDKSELLIAREDIRDVLHNYCRGVDRRDIELMRSVYHPGGIDHHSTFVGLGYDFCEYGMNELRSALFTQHRISNIRFSFADAAKAFVESYITAVTRVPVNKELLDFRHYGRYCDVFEKRDGAWKISYRLHLTDGNDITKVDQTAAARTRLADLPDQFTFPRGRPDADDPSYLECEIPSLHRNMDPVVGSWEKYAAEWAQHNS